MCRPHGGALQPCKAVGPKHAWLTHVLLYSSPCAKLCTCISRVETPLHNPITQVGKPRLGRFSHGPQLCVLELGLESWCVWPPSPSCAPRSGISGMTRQILETRAPDARGASIWRGSMEEVGLRWAVKDEWNRPRQGRERRLSRAKA